MGAQMEAAASAGLPSAAEDGTVTMTIHQVNGDGAGYVRLWHAMVVQKLMGRGDLRSDEGGDERAWRELAVEREGTRLCACSSDACVSGVLCVWAVCKPTDWCWNSGTTCTGGPNGDACVVRCRNAARAGPFGGCTAVTNAQPAANAKREVTVAEAEEALAEDLERRSVAVNKKRYVKSRVAGGKAGEWI
ncbi:hypothetical protein AG1IA_08967 [Rhizoctonia solani AG-1 IA]|uniref:Uncharacterized protein n=1 Tax=Thanatephorus cucumeris (strain AG1-IA) TaxID=983506 RepID=L8WJL7_THACA|nr:hypothetical protein AG1IA_08967 [Rhizoctonia solani AG-1 IA]